MKRRNFLKSAGGVLGALALCPSALIPEPEKQITFTWCDIKTIHLTDQVDPVMNGVYGIATCRITFPSGAFGSLTRIEPK